ncbi:RepB family plasmid replication initiator protein [Bacterioplanes sanyensis]|nr:RepB family plasmid replication initiator protein [Bacterioplanes sanyensis]
MRDIYSMSKPERQLIALLCTKVGKSKEYDQLYVSWAEWAEVFGNAPGDSPYDTLSAAADSLLHRPPVSKRNAPSVSTMHWVTGAQFFPGDKEISGMMHTILNHIMGDIKVGEEMFNWIVNKKLDGK